MKNEVKYQHFYYFQIKHKRQIRQCGVAISPVFECLFLFTFLLDLETFRRTFRYQLMDTGIHFRSQIFYPREKINIVSCVFIWCRYACKCSIPDPLVERWSDESRSKSQRFCLAKWRLVHVKLFTNVSGAFLGKYVEVLLNYDHIRVIIRCIVS